MADDTVKDQAQDVVNVGKTVLSYNFEDLIFGFAKGLANSNKRLGGDYISTMNKIIYKQSSIQKVLKGLAGMAGNALAPVIGSGLGADLFAAADAALDGELEVAYMNIEVEKPVVDPNGMITKTTLHLKMPRFLVYDEKPLRVSNGKIDFTMKVNTVYDQTVDQLDSSNKDNSGTWGRSLGFSGALSSSSSTKTDTNRNVTGDVEVNVEVNFESATEDPVGHQILGDLFKDIATPISG